MREIFSFAAPREFDLLACGDPILDLTFRVARAPCSEQKVLGERLPATAGGTVANTACAASRLGLAALAYGRTAADADGAFLRSEYLRFGVDTGQLREVAGVPSPTALVLLECDGEKALVYAPMPGPVLERASFVAALARCRLLYTMPYDAAEFVQMTQLARAAGVLVAIDIEAAMVSGPIDLFRLLSLCDLAFMSEASYHAILHALPDAAGLAALLHHGARMLVVTRGAHGAMLCAPGTMLVQDGFVADVADTTGAGDCFIGAFLSALLGGDSAAGALRFACAAGSIAVSAVGARAALPTRAQIAALLDHD